MGIRSAAQRQVLGIIVLIVSTTTLCAAAKSPPVVWQKTFGGSAGDVGYCICPTSDGGYAIAGSTTSFTSPTMTGNAYLIKIDADGGEQWAEPLGNGTEEYAEVRGQSVVYTTGGCVIVGSIFEPHFDRRICLIRADADGNQLWQQIHEVNTERGAEESGESVDVATDGGFIIAGYGRGSSTETVQACLLKTNAAGERDWLKTFGGPMIDEGHDAHPTADGGYILVGITASTPTQNDDVYLIKTDADGNVQWEKKHGGDRHDRGRSVRQTPDGGYIVAGDAYPTTESTSADILLLKTDTSGTLQWAKYYGGPSHETGHCVALTADGGYVAVGQTFSIARQTNEMYVVKTDAEGNLQWEKEIGGSQDETAYSVVQMPDDSYLVVGETQSYGAGLRDVYLVKLAPYALASDSWALYE